MRDAQEIIRQIDQLRREIEEREARIAELQRSLADVAELTRRELDRMFPSRLGIKVSP